ncbi:MULTISPECIES: succinylglutamate desuccinylase/aspartoacylase family protein [Rhizobium]|uniref:succinylglutamate desuccinylase/aspartoacylase family protein n=1 Tax=Rhizobium TaxID=379 RepID=UPI001619118A|nr:MULTISPECIES: succinylglutamate desuccinylase/aspartoacylase family protein [Rhizobium]MBB6305578.1 N-alpha-acetyl-L-2,4-diaminobutyrate deacetylase [Rhizobium leucaenae]MDK4743628.1 succinylglutamate desuccinylase/aspartoacylase family protein [Rhizobium sp. CNPSo 3464]
MRDLTLLQRLTGINPDQVGKHRSKLAISTGQGTPVELPMTIVRSGPGPLVLFAGGCHGDEYEGSTALLKLARELEPSDLSNGGVVIMPIINPPAIEMGTRASPMDGKDLNRVYPGKSDGSVSERIAYFITNAILPHVIAALDLHAGGYTTSMVPSIMGHFFEDDPQRTHATIEMMRSFRAPMGILIKEFNTEGMLDTTVEKMGLLFGCCELGGGGMPTSESIAVAKIGVRNIMKHFGLMQGALETPSWRGARRSVLVEALSDRHYSKATQSGIFEPLVDIGELVEAGQAIGHIHSIDWRGSDPSVQYAPISGLVYCRRTLGKIASGETVAVVARERTHV